MKLLFLAPLIFLCAFTYTGPETEIIDIINQERAAHELAPLAKNWELARLARYKTEEMLRLGYIGHYSPAYGTPRQMLDNFGVPASTVGVNAAKGQDNAGGVVRAWLTSPGHKKNLLDEGFTQAGVGFAYCQNGFPYWTIILIGIDMSHNIFH